VDDHTGENLKETLLEIFAEWGLDQKQLVAITKDSGVNVKLACRLLSWKKLICFGQNLELSISKSLQDSCIEEILKVYHQYVSNFLTAGRKQEI